MSVQFFTSKKVSSADPVEIAVNTAPSSFTSSEDGARNRKWTLTAANDCANLGSNPYRAALVVDNTQGASNAWIANSLSNAAVSDGYMSIPPGSSVTLSIQNLLAGTGAMCVVIEGASTTYVTELSFETA